MAINFPALPARAKSRGGSGLWIAAAAAGLVGGVLLVREETAHAEQKYPATGKFVEVDGVRLHYIDTGGSGPALVLLHGNGAMIADMEISGLVEQASRRYRVIVLDRPGYGHSERPRDRSWGPKQQADLFARAFAKLGVARPLVFGHSWGTQVALFLALDHAESVSGLVLASGYYFPTVRADAIAALPSAVPILGDLVRNTISPFIARLAAPSAFRKMFAPQPVPAKFSAEFPVGLTLRPSQIKATSEESAMMVPAAFAMEKRYRELRLPISILAGGEDGIVDTQRQSVRLRDTVANSELRELPGLGHMIHYFATEEILRAIDDVAARDVSAKEAHLRAS